MKTSEMIAMLENNPKLKFKNNKVVGTKLNDAGTSTIGSNMIGFVNKNLSWLRPNGEWFNSFDLSEKILSEEWTLIKPELKEVTFIEAINQDKPISNKRGTIKRCKPSWIISEGFLNLNDFNDKWYIMEESK